MTAEYQLQRFRPLLAVHLLWLLALAGALWLTGAPMFDGRVMVGALLFLLLNLTLLLTAVGGRLPERHQLLTGAAAMGQLLVVGWVVPPLVFPLLFLALVPLLLTVDGWGWRAFGLTLIFPISLFFLGRVGPGDGLLPATALLIWLSAAALAAWGTRRAAGGAGSLTNAAADGRIVAEVAAMLVRTSNHRQILEALVRGGVSLLNRGSQRRDGKGMALVFKPGIKDVLVVAASQNIDVPHTRRTYGLEGVLATLLQDGEPIVTDSSHAPFNQMRSLQGHHIMLFPLRTGIDVFGGVMFATRSRERAEDPVAQRTLIALADQTSLALHNAVLQQELHRNQDRALGGAEEARHQLARELHDGPVQRVAAISMQLEFIKALMSRQPDRAVTELEQLKQVAKQASQEMRTLLFTLRPVVLESEGLVAALSTFVERLREQERISITLEVDPLPRLSTKVEEVTFAILQEAIGNSRKYGQGAAIHVRLIKGNTWVVGQVEDEGPGFDLQSVSSSYATRASLGLLNMQERAEMVGGQLKIDTAPGKGTIVSVAVPFDR